MEELQTIKRELPDNLEELAKFALIGREKLTAVKAEIRAIKGVGLAKEVYEQKLVEAQEIAEAVLDAEVKIGELTAKMPKATPNNNPFHEIRNGADLVKPKSEQLSEIGIKQDTAERFERLARHPKAVETAKAEAREAGEIVTRQSVFDEIKKPHVINNSKDDEWYTPKQYIESAREVLGNIDLDPASNDFANETVQADTYYTEETDGLNQQWFGNVWLNPPYSTSLLCKFAEKVAEQEFEQAVILVNNATETGWFETLINGASAIVFHKGRIKYMKRDGEHGSPLQGQAFIYYGRYPERFLDVFMKYGWGALL